MDVAGPVEVASDPVPDEGSDATGDPRPGSPAGGLRRPSWLTGVLLIGLAALAFRVLLVVWIHPLCSFDADRWAAGTVTSQERDRLGAVDSSCFNVGGDALYLFLQGRLLAEGNGYASPAFYLFADGQISPGAAKPPAMPTLIAGLHLVGLRTPEDTRLLSALLGAAAVVVIGHVAGRLAGRRAAYLAAGIAAAYPMLWINDWKMLNDGPMALCTALVLLAAYHFRAAPRVKTAIWLGVALVGATFMRSEAANLLLFLVVPLCAGITRLAWRERVKLAAVVGATFAVLFLPWAAYNVARFHQPNLAGGSLGSVMINASCDNAWYGDVTGYLDFSCIDPVTQMQTGALAFSDTGAKDESDAEVIFRERANAYFQANERRFPIVAVARLGRMWGVYRPQQTVGFDINLEGRGAVDSWLGFAMYVVLLPTAIAGLAVLRRRRIPISPFIALALSVSLTAVMSFGLTRFRVPVEVGICILAGIAVDAALRRWVDPRRAGGDEPAPTPMGDLRAWRPTLPSGRALAVGGAVTAVVLGVLVWSAGAQPGQAVTPPSVTPAPPEAASACEVAQQYRLADRNRYSQLSPETIGELITGLRKLQPLAPPGVATNAGTAIALLEKAQAAGFKKDHLLDAYDKADREALVKAGLSVIAFAQSCGKATTPTTGPAPTAPGAGGARRTTTTAAPAPTTAAR